MLTKYIRIDDFPNGDLALHREWLKTEKKPHFSRLKPILDILNSANTPYILGVSPLLCDSEDISFLNDNLHSGFAVMHGFNHGWKYRDWSRITDSWPTGGEFSGFCKELLAQQFLWSLDALSKIKKVDYSHFIPPFNCYNQELLDVLSETPVKFIHGCSKETENYGLNKLNHYNTQQVTSVWQKTYSDIDIVLNYLSHPSQITLHWIYDITRRNYLENYKTLAQIYK